MYDFLFYKHKEELKKFWSLKYDNQLTFHKKKQEDKIVKSKSGIMKKNLKPQKRYLVNNKNEFVLLFLKNNKSLILLKPTNL